MKKIIIFLLIVLSTYQASAETRMRVVVIDSGLNTAHIGKQYMCSDSHYSVLGDKGIDDHGHGTNIIGLISSKINSSKYCITSIKVWSPKLNGLQSIYAAVKGMELAAKLNPTIVNISMDGEYAEPTEFIHLMKIVRNNAKIVVASGNRGRNLDLVCSAWPSCYKNIIPEFYRKNLIVVGSNTTNGNTGTIVNTYLDGKDKGTPRMSGTSQAAAIFTSQLVSK